jgi:hypothetical protein
MDHLKDLIERTPAIIKTASASPLGILALLILVGGALAYVFFGQRSTSERTRAIIFLAILTGIVAYGYAVVRAIPGNAGIYRLRVTVVRPNGVPSEDARVWSSFGGEPKKVAGGWQFDIPTASVPADGQVTLYAAEEASFLRGEAQVKLASDMTPAAVVTLVPEPPVTTRGIVIDGTGKAISDARVSIVGHGDEAVSTDATGGFALPSHAADGQQVLLHAEKEGYRAASQWHPAGSEPVTIVLDKE